MEQINRVSIRLVQDTPLVTDRSLNCPDAAAEEIGKFINDIDREVLCVINLNSKLQPVNFNIVSIGTVNQTLAVPRDIMKSAILSNAAYMMVMHNHPSGDLKPSKEDVKLTSRLIDACELLGIPLVDHIIVGPQREEYFSMKNQDTVTFNNNNRYNDDLKFLNFKMDNENKVAERDRGFAR